MELPEAFAIIVEEASQNVVIQEDHICSERVIHSLKECILPEKRVYTRTEASLDTPYALRKRLRAGTHSIRLGVLEVHDPMRVEGEMHQASISRAITSMFPAGSEPGEF